MNKEKEKPYKMRLSLHVLEDMGVKMYSNVPAVLSEAVANAWDADAESVDIVVTGKGKAATVIIADNGEGMDLGEINERFLMVGYKRREKGRDKTERGRFAMGRKGIGKMSLFSIANEITVHTKKKGSNGEAFVLKSADIKKRANQGEEYCYEPDPVNFIGDFDHGTKIELKLLRKEINIDALPGRIAQRFSVRCLGEMKVCMNGEQISARDSDLMKKMEYLIIYGKGKDIPKCPQVIGKNRVSRLVRFDKKGKPSKKGAYSVHGWIGMTKSATDLRKDKGDKFNNLAIFMRGKMAKEDMLESFSFSSFFSRYIIGEIHADFMDEKEDVAISSRQDFIQDDPRVKALFNFLEEELKNARSIRDTRKGEEAEKVAKSFFPGVEKWLGRMEVPIRNNARKLLGSINKLDVDEDLGKKTLFQHGILAFQNYRLKKLLDKLESIDSDKIKGFLSLATQMKELESSYYYPIIRGRLKIIEKLQDLTDGNAKERVMQEHLFENLWLVDQLWDKGDLCIMEKDIRRAFKVGRKKQDGGLHPQERMDIYYRTVEGTHVIVELKRYSEKIKENELTEQADKYRRTLKEVLRGRQDNAYDDIMVVCIVGKEPIEWVDGHERKTGIRSLWEKGIKVRTYDSLINDAERAYKEYFEISLEDGDFLKMVAGLDEGNNSN